MNPFWRSYFSNGLKPPTSFSPEENSFELHWIVPEMSVFVCLYFSFPVKLKPQTSWSWVTQLFQIEAGVFKQPRCSIYGIFTYIYHKLKPNVGKYSIHGAFEDILPLISRFLKVGERISFGGNFFSCVGTKSRLSWLFKSTGNKEPKKTRPNRILL